MNVRRATPADDALLVSIVMHPEVRKWTASDGAPDFEPSRYTAHPNSFAVIVDDGCFLAPALESKAYGVHTNLLPTCRGTQAIRAGLAALEYAFIHTDAEQLWSMVPANNPQALWFAHVMGFRDQFKRKDVWLSGGKRYDMQYLRMDIDDWVQRGPVAELGQAFHAALERQGSPVAHAEDETHDAYVGAAWALVAAGQVDKAHGLYNRWARAAGYHPFEIVSRDPLRLDIHDCVLRVEAGKFHIEEKRHA